MQYRAVVFDLYETLLTVFEQEPYYSQQMARDIGVTQETFCGFWHQYENSRTIGSCSLEAALRGTLQRLGLMQEQTLRMMMQKRLQDQDRIFSSIKPQITELLNELHTRGIKLGLISNCYLQERDRLMTSSLAGCFDVMMLSCEQQIAKPDPIIFDRCIKALDIPPGQILYVGDGGSRELEAASASGMDVVQACWYIRENEPQQPCGIKQGYAHALHPSDILQIVDKLN